MTLMSAYIIVRVEITDREAYRKYMERTPQVIAQFGGRFAVRGGEVVTLEGEPETRRVAILEFPTHDQAQAFYESKEYQEIAKIREGAADVQFILVDGYLDHY